MMKVTSQRAMCPSCPKKATHAVRMSDQGKNFSVSEDIDQDIDFIDAFVSDWEQISQYTFLQHLLESLLRRIGLTPQSMWLICELGEH